ncbi:MAG: 4Fe-4S dicluster domain-containing protein [Tissierellia bacterium]|jgi:polyferredoxin|nr:4Fe-4S dicluster domain-containing protein [Tissierellia bacterium]MDD3227011.1 4Fe-4S dicluster domain-containing protein [Tissierellia bacterium]MDD3751116.1 4Fe-4S dicluster domain-containing protein [Tissierellia bacterium]MDD4046624.1 4Fe-4S dicluster domain-containing protein [Tissierellia bacterium]MDD4678537.1 4Fe-4S dicluster domain-containing protein [Tissierellia bacterium]
MANKRKIIQVITLIIFVALIVLGKVQLWMAVFLGGLLLSTVKGRLYCGYVCPINTVMEIVDNDAAKRKRKRFKTPKWAKSNIVRVGILVLFFIIFVFIQKTGKKLPVLPALFALGIILTVFFEPSFWHRYLCPYGTLFSLFSKKSKVGYTISEEGCIKCGMCVKNCPADAIKQGEKNTVPYIIQSDCIVCGKCEAVCPTKVISYDKAKSTETV